MLAYETIQLVRRTPEKRALRDWQPWGQKLALQQQHLTRLR